MTVAGVGLHAPLSGDQAFSNHINATAGTNRPRRLNTRAESVHLWVALCGSGWPNEAHGETRQPMTLRENRVMCCDRSIARLSATDCEQPVQAATMINRAERVRISLRRYRKMPVVVFYRSNRMNNHGSE